MVTALSSLNFMGSSRVSFSFFVDVETGYLCSPSCPEIGCVNHAGLDIRDPPASVLQYWD